MRAYYWFEPDATSSAVNPTVHSRTKQAVHRPDAQGVERLRTALLQVMKIYMRDNLSQLDIQHVMRMLCHCGDGLQLQSILAFLAELCETAPEAAAAIVHCGGLEVLAHMLQQDDEATRCRAIELVAKLIKAEVCGGARALTANGAAVLQLCHVAAVKGSFSAALHLSLLLASLDRSSAADVGFGALEVAETDSIAIPQLYFTLCVASLVSLDMVAMQKVLGDTALLLQSSTRNCEAFCTVPDWQGWLLQALTVEGASPQIEEVVHQIFHTCHYHTFRYDRGAGWKCFERTIELINLAARQNDTTVFVDLSSAARAALAGKLDVPFKPDLVQRLLQSHLAKVRQVSVADSGLLAMGNMEHLLLLAEGAVFPSAEGVTPGQSLPPAQLAEVDWELAQLLLSVLETPQLASISSFQGTFTAKTVEANRDAARLVRGGFARIALRLLIAGMQLAEGADGVTVLYGQLLRFARSNLRQQTDDAQAVILYGLARLEEAAAGAKADDQIEKTDRFAVHLLDYVHNFRAEIYPCLRASFGILLCSADQINRDNQKRDEMSKADYAAYLVSTYINTEWAKALQLSCSLSAETANRKPRGKRPTPPGQPAAAAVAAVELGRAAAGVAAALEREEGDRLALVSRTAATQLGASQRAWKAIRRGLLDEFPESGGAALKR